MIDSQHSPVLIAAGGTGGHVYPALAVAEILRSRNVPVVWLGTPTGLEARVVPAAGFDIEWVNVAGIRGKNMLHTLMAPLKLCRSLLQAWQIFSRRRPRAVLGMGGFVAGPGGAMAVLRRRPLIIHEQNSVAGLTNRLLNRFARRVFTAYPGVFPAAVSSEQIGNPVRNEICGPAERAERLTSHAPCHLLVVGGSRGARTLNRIVPAALGLCGCEFSVWHQTGLDDHQTTTDAYSGATNVMETEPADATHEFRGAVRADVRVTPFIESMAEAYAWADVIVCRAGAMTVSELAAAGLGSVLVPYPHAVDDHQTTNALWLVEAEAAIMVAEPELSAATLATTLDELCNDRERLIRMARNAYSLHVKGAAEKVADALQEEAL